MSSQERESRHKKTCDCGNDEFLFAKDLNLDKAWKAGNMYCRICTDCGNRYFLSKSMYQSIDDKYVILDGEDDPIPVFDCPACEETVTGMPDQCPYCDVEFDWGDQKTDEDEDHRERDDDPDDREDERSADPDDHDTPEDTTTDATT